MDAANHSTSDVSAAIRFPAQSRWNQQIVASDDSPVNRAESGADGSKKPAWNKPSNGVTEVGPVMGAELWPALSESTRVSPKASSSDSPKPISDGSAALPQAAGILHHLSNNQMMTNNINSSLAPPNHAIPMRQKSMKRGGGGSSSGYNNVANGVFTQPPLSPHIQSTEVPHDISGKSEPAVAEQSPRDRTNKESGQRGVGSQSRSGNDHIHRSDSFKKGNSGPHHHHFAGRGNQDRGNHELNSQRSFNGRDSHLQQQRVSPRGYRSPSHVSTPFVHPQPVPIRPYPMVYPDVPPQVFYYAPPPESLRGVPLVAPMPPPAMYYAVPDSNLIPRIVHQIDYYFSDENLVKDTYLRSNMDDQGWVPVQLIASFKKMSQLTENIQLILDAIRVSSVIEVQGDKLRRRYDWSRWIMPNVQSPNTSSPQGQGSFTHEMLIAGAHNLSLEENSRYQGEIASSSRSSSGDFSQSRAPGLAAVAGVPERIFSVRSPSE